MISFRPRKRKCKVCKTEYMAQRPMQNVCNGYCANKDAIQKRERAEKDAAKRERAQIRAAKEAIKPRSKHMAEAQQAFNAWVRARDAGRPCISCDGIPNDAGLITGSRIDAGHYRSTGACPELRFEPLNCHAQCVKCNRNLSGNAVEYRIRLVKRIGAAKVEWLEGNHPAKKYTIEDLQAIKAKYRAMTRELKRAAEQTIGETA